MRWLSSRPLSRMPSKAPLHNVFFAGIDFFFGHLEPMRILRFRGPSCHPIVPLTRFLGRQLDIGVSQDVLGIIDDKVAPVPAMAFTVSDAHALNLQVAPEFVGNCVEIRQ